MHFSLEITLALMVMEWRKAVSYSLVAQETPAETEAARESLPFYTFIDKP